MDPADRDTSKYVDQFFSFWETSGKSNIARAVEFLRQMDCDERVSVVTFSDSKSPKDVERYASTPPQYFRALPCFMGIRLVGTESSRIVQANGAVRQDERGKYLGEVDFCGSKIELSPAMNAVIGGRGSGKSVLLDSIANSLDPAKCATLGEKRIAFLESMPIALKNLAGEPIVQSTFKFDYYNQNYITRLFNLEGEEYSKELESYFGDAFSSVKDIDVAGIKASNRAAFGELLAEGESFEDENISGLVEKYGVDEEDGLDIKIRKNDSVKIDKKSFRCGVRNGS